MRERKCYTKHLPGTRESDDVWNIRARKTPITFNLLILAFLTENYDLLK